MLIVAWHGTLASIPAGWVLCDGTGGTPDLRDKFIKAPANGVDPGGSGGNNTHTHAQHGSQSHSGASVGDHAALTHSGIAITNHSTGLVGSDILGDFPIYGWTHSVTQSNQHAAVSHTVSSQGDDHAAQSHAASTDNQPAYYTVAFIAKS
jgi:hypothetical protein